LSLVATRWRILDILTRFCDLSGPASELTAAVGAGVGAAGFGGGVGDAEVVSGDFSSVFGGAGEAGSCFDSTAGVSSST